MKVISMHKVDAAMEAGGRPSKELIQGMGQLMGAMRQANALVDGDGLLRSATRVRVKVSNGVAALEKGPYAGGNELVAGMVMIKVRDMDEAVDWGTRYAKAAGDGELEIGPVTEGWDLGFMPKPADAPLRCLLLRKATPAYEAGKPLPAEAAGAVEALTAEMKQAGVLMKSALLEPSKTGQRIKVVNKKTTVMDGPFAESKELIAGFVILEVPSMAAAREWCGRFAEVIGDVEMDVRVIAT